MRQQRTMILCSLYFTSGTTGMPKMVNHDFIYPLGHILTAKYWQNVQDNGLHFTVADTGWAKSAWGKIYGQWLSGSAVMTYDYDKFVPKNLMEVIEKYKVDYILCTSYHLQVFNKRRFNKI